ncbi:MAG: 2-oxoacid:acceptor oxidoreductase family protein [Patescibacteria group bacterium]|jgi:2-oxoacid:acceptor oxidoreductase gamma subunit (pyruvate/2-ketoisovalerate family)
MSSLTTQVRVHGRGGQGVVTAAELVALAATLDGKEAQAFPFFGVERSGAPVVSFARLSKTPIKTREQIYRPDYLIVQDETLIGDKNILAGAHAQTKIIINTSLSNTEIFQQLKKSSPKIKIHQKNIICTPATVVALKVIGKNIVNTVILAALAKNSSLFSLDSLKEAVREKLKSKGKDVVNKNLKAITLIYES